MGWDYSKTYWITDRSFHKNLTFHTDGGSFTYRIKIFLLVPCSWKGGSPRSTRCSFQAVREYDASKTDKFRRIAKVHNSSMGHLGHALTKRRLNDLSVTDRMITEFIRQCPCCQVMSRLPIQIKTHPFTCASYNPFGVFHLDHIDMSMVVCSYWWS